MRIAGIEVTLTHGNGAAGGTLEREELEVALLSANLGGAPFPSAEEVEFLFNRINSDGSGRVTFLQFLALMTECQLAVDEQRALAALKAAVRAYEEGGASAGGGAAGVSVGGGAVGNLFEGSAAMAAAAQATDAVHGSMRQREAAAEAVLSAAEAEAEHSRGVQLSDLEIRAHFDGWVRRALGERRQMLQWQLERGAFVAWLRTGRGVEDGLRRQLAEVEEVVASKAAADDELARKVAALAAAERELEAARRTAAAQAKELTEASAKALEAQDELDRVRGDAGQGRGDAGQGRGASGRQGGRDRGGRRQHHSDSDSDFSRGPTESDFSGDDDESDYAAGSTDASASESGRQSSSTRQRQQQERGRRHQPLKKKGSWAAHDFETSSGSDE